MLSQFVSSLWEPGERCPQSLVWRGGGEHQGLRWVRSLGRGNRGNSPPGDPGHSALLQHLPLDTPRRHISTQLTWLCRYSGSSVSPCTHSASSSWGWIVGKEGVILSPARSGSSWCSQGNARWCWYKWKGGALLAAFAFLGYASQPNMINLFSPKEDCEVWRAGISPWPHDCMVPGSQLGFLLRCRCPSFSLCTRCWRCRAEHPDVMVLQPKTGLGDLKLWVRHCDS